MKRSIRRGCPARTSGICSARNAGALLTVSRTTWSGQRIVEINHMVMPGSMYEIRYGWQAD